LLFHRFANLFVSGLIGRLTFFLIDRFAFAIGHAVALGVLDLLTFFFVDLFAFLFVKSVTLVLIANFTFVLVDLSAFVLIDLIALVLIDGFVSDLTFGFVDIFAYLLVLVLAFLIVNDFAFIIVLSFALRVLDFVANSLVLEFALGLVHGRARGRAYGSVSRARSGCWKGRRTLFCSADGKYWGLWRTVGIDHIGFGSTIAVGFSLGSTVAVLRLRVWICVRPLSPC
jgi:hypothetical protein